MLKLPPQKHPVQGLIDPTTIERLANPGTLVQLPAYREAVRKAVAYMAAESAARSVNTLCLRADGRVWMIRVGPKGGVKKLWDFGNPLAPHHA